MKTKLFGEARFLTLAVLCHLAATAAARPVPQANENPGGFHLLSGENVPPQVQILFPPPDIEFHSTTRIRIRVEATDADGTITEVRFYIGTNLIGSVTNPPYEIVSEPDDPGREAFNAFVISAVAVDNLGASTTSAPVKAITGNHPYPTSFWLTDAEGGYFVQNGEHVVRTAPATFELQGKLFISDGYDTPVDFYVDTNIVGTVVDPPYRVTVTNLPAGEYTLRLGNLSIYSGYLLFPEAAPPTLHVIVPSFLQPSRPDSNSFTFNFDDTLPRATNIIEQSGDLRTWIPIATNVSTTNSFSFRDAEATNSLSRFYRVKLFPWERILP
jgi:hypothetical protein